MCFVTYTFCFICKEETFNEPCICEPKMCNKFIFFQRENELCETCFYQTFRRPNMLRFKKKGYQLRKRFVRLY